MRIVEVKIFVAPYYEDLGQHLNLPFKNSVSFMLIFFLNDVIAGSNDFIHCPKYYCAPKSFPLAKEN